MISFLEQIDLEWSKTCFIMNEIRFINLRYRQYLCRKFFNNAIFLQKFPMQQKNIWQKFLHKRIRVPKKLVLNWWMIVSACFQWFQTHWERLKRRHQFYNEKFWQMQDLRNVDLGNQCFYHKVKPISNTYVTIQCNFLE